VLVELSPPRITFTECLPHVRSPWGSALKHYIWNQSTGGWLTVRVLIVDGEPLIRNLLTRWLGSWGYDALAAASADEALAWMRLAPADIVIADSMMPEHEGIWLLDQIREHWPDTMVIMEKGGDNQETSLRARLSGAVDHLPAALSPDLLRRAVERARSAIRPPMSLAPAAEPPARLAERLARR
jgi:two-component system OmpR family response regulator